MKTILKILAVLMLIGMVAGGWFLVVEHTSWISTPELGQERPASFQNEGQLPSNLKSGMDPRSFGRPNGTGPGFGGKERNEGDGHDRGNGGTFNTGGLPDVFVTLFKLGIISVIIMVIQTGFNLFGRLFSKPAQG